MCDFNLYNYKKLKSWVQWTEVFAIIQTLLQSIINNGFCLSWK